MSKRTTRSASRLNSDPLRDITTNQENRLDPIREEEEVTQPVQPESSSLGAPILDSKTAIPTMSATMKAIYISSNLIQPADFANPVPDTLNKVDLKVGEFKPAEQEYAPKFLYDTALNRAIPIRVGEITVLPRIYVIPARNVFNTSTATEDLVLESVWATATLGRNSDVKTPAYEVAPGRMFSITEDFPARLDSKYLRPDTKVRKIPSVSKAGDGV